MTDPTPMPQAFVIQPEPFGYGWLAWWLLCWFLYTAGVFALGYFWDGVATWARGWL